MRGRRIVMKPEERRVAALTQGSASSITRWGITDEWTTRRTRFRGPTNGAIDRLFAKGIIANYRLC